MGEHNAPILELVASSLALTPQPKVEVGGQDLPHEPACPMAQDLGREHSAGSATATTSSNSRAHSEEEAQWYWQREQRFSVPPMATGSLASIVSHGLLFKMILHGVGCVAKW